MNPIHSNVSNIEATILWEAVGEDDALAVAFDKIKGAALRSGRYVKVVYGDVNVFLRKDTIKGF